MSNRPQRIALSAPIGSLLKDAAPAVTVSPKHAGYQDWGYLAMVRHLPCLCCGMEPCGEAAHVRYASAAFGKSSGLQKKPEDRWALGLCRACHQTAAHAQHRHGEEQWWREIGINPLLVCERLYARRGDLVAMRAVVMVAISERSSRK